MITRNFNLYLNAGHSVPLVINVNQYDSGEQWVFTLYNADGTQYTPSTGAIVGIKSDGLGIINSGSVVDGKVVINETQQMTAAVGKAVFELMIDSQTHGTANFVVLVEEKPGNNADLSESDLSLLQEAIDATSPLPTGGSVGQVLTKTASGSTWSDAGTPTQEQVADAVSDWADEHITVETGVVIDTSLSVAGAAADSKKVGDELSDLKSAIASGGSFTDEVKDALEELLSKVAYVDGNGQTYLDALHNAMYRPATLVSISAVYTQSGTVYTFDSLDSLKDDLVVTANYDDYSSRVVTNYTLSGTLVEGTSTITVAYSGETTTFDVVAVTRQMQISSMVTGVMTWAANTGLRYAHATPSRMVMNPCAFPMVKGRTYTLSLGNQWGTYLAGIRVAAGNTAGLDFTIDSSTDKNWTALNESILDDGNKSSDYVYVATEDDSVFTVSIKKPDATNMTNADLAAVFAEITLVES